MDRISALRNIESALQEYENGACDLATLEERVGSILRTYATEFEAEEINVFRAVGGEADGTIVAAADESAARSKIRDRYDETGNEFTIEQLD